MNKTKPTLLMAAALALAAALAPAQDPARPQPEFIPAQVIAAVEAPYPANSIAQGTVVLEATIGPAGEIEEVRVVRSIPSLTQPAERALQRWRFRPATLDGEPVRSKVAVAFTFTRPWVVPSKQ